MTGDMLERASIKPISSAAACSFPQMISRVTGSSACRAALAFTISGFPPIEAVPNTEAKRIGFRVADAQ